MERGQQHREFYKLFIFTVLQSQRRLSWIPKLPALIVSTEVGVDAWELHQLLKGAAG